MRDQQVRDRVAEHRDGREAHAPEELRVDAEYRHVAFGEDDDEREPDTDEPPAHATRSHGRNP